MFKRKIRRKGRFQWDGYPWRLARVLYDITLCSVQKRKSPNVVPEFMKEIPSFKICDLVHKIYSEEIYIDIK